MNPKKVFVVMMALAGATFAIPLVPAFAQVDTAWVRRYNGPGNGDDEAHAIAVDGSGNVYVTGSTEYGGYYDCATIKYYPDGDTAWVRRYDGPLHCFDGATAIGLDYSGNVYVTGFSYDTTYVDYITIKYYPNGDTAWVRRYKGPGNDLDVAHAIAVDGSANAYVTGRSIGSGTGRDYATIKYYPNGDTAWVRRYNGPGNDKDWARAIAVDGSGNVYVTGRSGGSGTGFDYATIKYYPDGDTAWVRRYNGPGNNDDDARAIAVDDFGNVYVTGESYDSGTNFDYLTIKYYANGDTAWVRRYNGPGNDQDGARSIAVDGSGNAYVTGESEDNETSYDYATIKYHSNGDTAWVRRYDGPGNYIDKATAIAVDGVGSVYVTGESDDSSGIYNNYATVKYHASGNQLWVERYDGQVYGSDVAYGITVDNSGNVYVTGESWRPGMDTDYATIKYVQSTCQTVGNITICANSFIDLGEGNVSAEGNVRIGDQTGEKLYLYLGYDGKVFFDANTGTVDSVVYTNTKLSVNWIDYIMDNITSLEIDAQAGRVSFGGRVHYASDATFQSSFSGACTLEVNEHELYARIEFDDSYFGSGTVGIHRGIWDLEGCPFMGMSDDINLTMPVGLTDLTLIDGEITLGVFPNTGIFRVGLTQGQMEFRESGGAFGFDLVGAIPIPGPSQGMLDIDLAHMRVNVVRDIPIDLWEYPKEDRSEIYSSEFNSKTSRTDWSSLRKIDQNTYVVDAYDAEGNKHQKLLFDVGLTIKGEEPYTDLDCDGYYDPDEPFEDEDEDGEWDEGTTIALLDSSQQPIFDAHGHATLDLTLASYVHFTCGEAVLDIDYPNSDTIGLEIWEGLQLGNIFTLDLATGTLWLDFENQEYSAEAEFTNVYFPGANFNAYLLIAFDPFKFRSGIERDFQILGVDVSAAQGSLFVDEERLYLMADLSAFDLLEAHGKVIWKEAAVDGDFDSDFYIDDWHLAQLNNSFHFAPGQCMSGTASIIVCSDVLLWEICISVPFSYSICSASNWSFAIDGISVSLGCPANLHIYDLQGRHTGINEQGGIDTEIPGSEFYVFEDVGQQLAFLSDPDLDGGYTIDIEGLSDSVFDLSILYPNSADGNTYNVGYFEEPTEEGALHRVNLDVNNDWTLWNDLDGDSSFESQTEPDSTAEATLDTTMVTITNVSSHILSLNEANITWNTNVPATSEVLYRSEYDSTYKSVSDTALTTSHSVLLDSILTTVTHYYIVVSIDTLGNIASFLEKSFKLNVGDVNGDGVINSADIVYLINYLFKGGPAPEPLEAGDVNCDGIINSADVVYLINYLFKGGPPPGCP